MTVDADDLGDLLLVGRAVQHLALVPVGDAQHFRAVGLVAAALPPQLRRLDGRHQHLEAAGRVLLLADDPLDVAQHPQAQRQPAIDAGAGLADHPAAQHQTVRDDLRLGRVLLQGRQEIAGKSHDGVRDLRSPGEEIGEAEERAGAPRPGATLGQRRPRINRSVSPPSLGTQSSAAVDGTEPWRIVRLYPKLFMRFPLPNFDKAEQVENSDNLSRFQDR